MDQRDLEQIEVFLGLVSKGSLFEYYDLAPGASDEDIEQAVKRRRTWAQGQQANPKYRDEAIWLIRNNALVRRLMVDEREDYLAEVARRRVERELEKLSTFIRGALLTGVLSTEGERAIRAQGAELGLSDEQVSQRIDEILLEVGGRRAEGNAILEEFFDYYALLNLTPEASLEEIEAAHREQVRKARNLRDKSKSSQLYERLDQAWVHLSTRERRADYDRRWRMRHTGTEPPPEPIGYLPPPEGVKPPPGPPASTALHEVQAPPREPPPREAPPREPPVQANFQAPPASGGADLGPARPPRPPPDIKSTIPINPTARSSARKPPRLTISSPDVVQLKVGRKPAGHAFMVRNSGQGRMPGRVTSDRDWLVVMRPRLDADAHQQDIQLVIDPSKMPKSRSTATVTVVTDHGDRRSITFEVERSALPVPLIAGGVVVGALLLLILALALGLLGGEAGASSTLEVIADPGADEILVADKPAGSGQRLLVREGFPLDEPFKVRATLDGFSPAEKTVQVPEGGEQSVRLVLSLTDPLDVPPADSERYVEFKPDAESITLSRRADAMAACLRSVKASDGLRPAVQVDLYFGRNGKLRYLEFHDQNFQDDPEALKCLRRQLRAASYPTLEGGDYGLIRDYTVEANAAPGSG